MTVSDFDPYYSANADERTALVVYFGDRYKRLHFLKQNNVLGSQPTWQRRLIQLAIYSTWTDLLCLGLKVSEGEGPETE